MVTGQGDTDESLDGKTEKNKTKTQFAVEV